MLILPAIDLIDGQVVRLTQGDYDRRTDYGLHPVEVARQFAEAGARWIHIVDLDAAKSGDQRNLEVIRRLVEALPDEVHVELGGGIRDMASARRGLEAGAKRVVIGTALVRDPEFARAAFAEFGEAVVAGIDTRDGQVAIDGWQIGGGMDGLDLARRLVDQGCRRIITTDIATDGAFTGPNIPWLRAMAEAVPVPVIASGGVASLEDIGRLQTEVAGIEGVIVGKALYEGRIDLRAAVSTLAQATVP